MKPEILSPNKAGFTSSRCCYFYFSHLETNHMVSVHHLVFVPRLAGFLYILSPLPAVAAVSLAQLISSCGSLFSKVSTRSLKDEYYPFPFLVPLIFHMFGVEVIGLSFGLEDIRQQRPGTSRRPHWHIFSYFV